MNEELGIRASYVKQAVFLATDLVKARVPTIIFGHSRNNVEVMLRYLRDAAAKERIPAARRSWATAGGYLPDQRREIEARLRAGDILAVVATNALELGIDIGELDAVICAGYPGSIAGVWQRFGRAGRRGERSICVLVTSSTPLDQYLAREPEYLLGAPVEEARIDPGQRRGAGAAREVRRLRATVSSRRDVRRSRRRGDGRCARLPRVAPGAARGGRHLPLGGGFLPGQ